MRADESKFLARLPRKLSGLLLLLALPVAVQAQFTFVTNNGAITITAYTGPGGAVMIPETTNGLPITSIGDWAFYYCSNLTSVAIGNNVNVTSIGDWAFFFCVSLTNVTIGNSVTNIGDEAFNSCSSLTSVTIGNSVTSIGDGEFYYCSNLTSVTIGNSVTSIGGRAFEHCISLTSIVIPGGVTSIGSFAFFGCSELTGVYFRGDAPTSVGSDVFTYADNVIVYYLPGTAYWEPWFAERPTALWELPYPVILSQADSFGVQADGFGFIVSWATNDSVVVEACTNLANLIWSPVETNALTDGWCYFSDARWTNHPARFYRLRWP
jgi:hypothetical protein